jgi:hypothetical protein
MTDEPFRIEFERSGGFAGIILRTTVDSTELSSAQAAEMEGLLASLENTPLPTAAPRGADRFQYELKVTHGNRQTVVTVADGSLTEDQRRLVDLLTEFARRPQASPTADS